jgi:hypothetical protein
MDEVKVATALKYYEALNKAKRAYAERQRQAKKNAGTYRPRGRPKKTAVEPI